jgi:hypothetical protein
MHANEEGLVMTTTVTSTTIKESILQRNAHSVRHTVTLTEVV